MESCKRRDPLVGPWMAAEGGTSWSVECLYQPSPNVYTKSVLYSKSDWLAYGYLTNIVILGPTITL